MDWLGDDESVNGVGEVEGVVPTLPPINGAEEEVEIKEDENQNAGGEQREVNQELRLINSQLFRW